MNILKFLSSLLLLFSFTDLNGQVCNPAGNLVIFSNYDGGILTINVDQNIPNLKIGICTYEPIQVNFTGPFVGNITQVIYGGFNSNQNNNNCGQGNFPTSITGVPAGIVTINPPLDPPSVGLVSVHGNGSSQMVAATGICDTTMATGGGNTPDQIVYYFESQTGGSLYAHHTTYSCYLNSTLNISGGGTCCIDAPGGTIPPTGIICNPAGNVFLYSNYAGGILNINIDQNIPNIKIGVSTYEATQINITGSFAANVTEVIYAGYNGQNNTSCSTLIPTTVVTGVSPSIVTIYGYATGNGAFTNYLGDPVFVNGPNLVNCMVGGSCDNSNAGGTNSAGQIVQFFLAEFGAGSVLFSHSTNWGCFTNNISNGGDCCVSNVTNPINPIYTGGDTYNFILPTTYSLCGGPLVINLSSYPVLFQPTIYTGYVWSNGATGPNVTFTTPGTYSFTVTDYCHSGSEFLTDTIIVTACCSTPLPNPTFTILQPTCTSNSNNITFTTPLGPDFQYSIDGGVTFQSNPLFSNASVGNHALIVKNTLTLCISGSGVSVVINPSNVVPVIQVLSTTNPSCFGATNGGASVNVTNGNGPITYAWSNGNSDPNPSNFGAGTYTVTATNNFSCSATQTITITNPPEIEIASSFTNPDCGEDNGIITTSSSGGITPYTYSWFPFNDITNSLDSLPIGNYSIVVTDQNNCTASETFTLIADGNIVINVTPSNSIIVAGDTVELIATGADNYFWSPSTGLSCANCPNPIAVVSVGTVYTVTGTTADGCSGESTVAIAVPIVCDDVFVPTIFTPDIKGPLENNTICIFGSCISYFQFTVYDRWGEIVFKSGDQLSCWDGKFKGQDAQAGQYAYKLTLTKNDGSKIEEKGNITLIR